MSHQNSSLLSVLKQYFGYTSFRPFQEQIIRDAMAGHDVFALLPTGGGKSLCFQMPALMSNGLTVVISPLIALMKDQVDALQSMGVAATFLNSSLNKEESRARYRGLHTHKYRMLYVAPERVVLDGMLSDLKNWNLKLIAIDEAHCVSEWGHDFRPEYRQLAMLRGCFPDAPVMALTATATERVRTDIVQQLKLNNPRCYVASFNRPNLTYRVMPRSGGYKQLLDYLRARPRESGIVYCMARKTTESLADDLRKDGIPARPYHAGLSNAERNTNQDLFLKDEVRVICATIAFGMGINKPNVRFVVHYDLPKNIEGYYQETGRAGRDGLPGECLLLFNAGDVMKQKRFIDEKTDPTERQVAREQLNKMVHYAEIGSCRRAALLAYFGETYGQPNCEGCDNCLSPREMYDGTLQTQKFLSCIHRVKERSGFTVGLNHIVEVLSGADTENVRKWGHSELSTYGIGKDVPRKEWQAIGRELIRLGLVSQSSDMYGTLDISVHGRDALKQRKNIQLTRPMKTPEPVAHRAGEITCDEGLFEVLRQLRKSLADAQGVPPYIVFSDVSLRQMARHYPVTSEQFARISGVGEKKLAEYGQTFMQAIAEYQGKNPRQIFAEDSFQAAPVSSSALSETVFDSLRRFRAGDTVQEIASHRGLVPGTIYRHLETAVEAGEKVDIKRLFNEEDMKKVDSAFSRSGWGNLVGAHEVLGGRYDMGALRIYRIIRQRKKQ